MSGGHANDGVRVTSNESVLQLSGGQVTGTIQGHLNSPLIEISGGTISGDLLALDSSSFTIRGSGFNFPEGEISVLSGTLTGVLEDGTPINLPFSRASTASIELEEVTPAPSLMVSKIDSLYVDNDQDGRADPGDIIEYSVAISNVGTAAAQDVVLSDTPDANSSLEVGSVSTTQGAVESGNQNSETFVLVDIGTIAATGGQATITFRALVNDPFPESVLTISNQAEISGSNFPMAHSDDPDTEAFLDSTVTEIANTALDVCESDLSECEEDLAMCLPEPNRALSILISLAFLAALATARSRSLITRRN